MLRKAIATVISAAFVIAGFVAFPAVGNTTLPNVQRYSTAQITAVRL